MLKNKVLQGFISGLIFTIIISSICKVTFYGLEYGVASSSYVFLINLIFMIISGLFVFGMKKIKKFNKINPIVNVILITFGILILLGIFFQDIIKIFTIEYVMAGPTVRIPNIMWLIVLMCVPMQYFSIMESEKYDLIKFLMGEILSVIILFVTNSVLTIGVNSLQNAMEINKIANSIIQGVLAIEIISSSLYITKKFLKNDKK